MNIFKKIIYDRVTKWGNQGATTGMFGPRRQAGILVTHDSALTYSAIWRAVNLISQQIATLPWTVNQRDSKRQVETLWTHPAAKLLALQPNDETDALAFREVMAAWALTWGNGYAEIVHDQANRPQELWQIEPSRVNPNRDQAGRLVYEVSNGTAANSYLTPDKMFHLKGLGFDGTTGYSVIAYAAKTIGLGLATEQFGSNFFENGANAGGVLQHPSSLSDTAIEHLKKSLLEATTGKNSGSPMVLEEGMTWETITVPPDDAQFLETRKFGVAEVARWYGIPLHKLHEMDKSSFNNIEQQNIEFVTDALMPWIRRFEMEANIKLVSPASRGRVFTKMNVNALMRGDTESRVKYYQGMTSIGAMNANEVREKEDENGIGPAGDKYIVQMNLTTLEKVGETNEIQDPVPAEEDPAPGDPDPDEEQEPAARIILDEAAQRITTRCGHRAKEALKNYDGDREGLIVYLHDFSDDQERYMRKQLEPTVKAFGMKLDLQAFVRDEVEQQVTAIIAAFDAADDGAMFHVEHMSIVDRIIEVNSNE